MRQDEVAYSSFIRNTHKVLTSILKQILQYNRLASERKSYRYFREDVKNECQHGQINPDPLPAKSLLEILGHCKHLEMDDITRTFILWFPPWLVWCYILVSSNHPLFRMQTVLSPPQHTHPTLHPHTHAHTQQKKTKTISASVIYNFGFIHVSSR